MSARTTAPKLSTEVAKQQKVESEKKKKAIEEVMKSPALKKLYQDDLNRQTEHQKSTVELWWSRGADVVNIRRAQSGDGKRAEYGANAIGKLAAALDQDSRSFHRAADFWLMFDGDTRDRQRFFKTAKSEHDFDLSWSHVEKVLKHVTPVHADVTDPTFKDMLSLAAANQLSVRAFEKELTKRFKKNRKPARKLDVYVVYNQLLAAVTAFDEVIGEKADLLVETVGEDLTQVADPSGFQTKLAALRALLGQVEQKVMDSETKLTGLDSRIRQFLDQLRAAEQAEQARQPAAGPEMSA